MPVSLYFFAKLCCPVKRTYTALSALFSSLLLQSNADVQDWMKNQGYGRDYSRLQAYHTGRVVRLAEAAGKNAMVWQEAAEEPGIKNLPELTVVQVWKWAKDLGKVAQSAGLRGVEAAYKGQQAAALRGWPSAMQGALSWLTGAGASSSDDYWRSEMSRVTKTHRAVLSAPFYLNLAAPDEAAWEKYWQVEPASFSGTAEQKERMVGGEASVWGELVDATNALQKTWPLAAAVAERLWSDQSVQDLDTARERLQELRCRLMIRGIPAAPLGPGFCPSDVD